MAERTVVCGFCGKSFQVAEDTTKAFCVHCGAETQIGEKTLQEKLDEILDPKKRYNTLLDYLEKNPDDQDAALLENESYVILWVSDLFCSSDDGMSIITRLSDGSLVKEAEIYAADGSKSTITHGLYLQPRQSNNPRGVVAIAGDDFTLMDSSSRPRYRNQRG